MARTCTVCTHKDRLEIETAHLNGTPLREIMERYGLAKSSLHRHCKSHLNGRLVKSFEKKELSQADTLFKRIEVLITNMEDIYTRNKKTDDAMALKSLNGLRGVYQLLVNVVAESQKQKEIAGDKKTSFLEFLMTTNQIDESIQQGVDRLTKEEKDEYFRLLTKIGGGPVS